MTKAKKYRISSLKVKVGQIFELPTNCVWFSGVSPAIEIILAGPDGQPLFAQVTYLEKIKKIKGEELA